MSVAGPFVPHRLGNVGQYPWKDFDITEAANTRMDIDPDFNDLQDPLGAILMDQNLALNAFDPTLWFDFGQYPDSGPSTTSATSPASSSNPPSSRSSSIHSPADLDTTMESAIPKSACNANQRQNTEPGTHIIEPFWPRQPARPENESVEYTSSIFPEASNLGTAVATPVPSPPCESERASDSDSPSQRCLKKAHSVVEQRYRDKVNGKIDQLLQALRATEGSSCSAFTSEGKKVRKSDVLDSAIAYIYQSEVETRHLSDEVRRLNETIHALLNPS